MIYKFVVRLATGLLLLSSLSWIGVTQPSKTISAPQALTPEPQQPQGQLTPPSRTEAPKPTAAPPLSTRPFQIGEKLSFNVSWANFVTAARMEMEVTGQGAFFGQQGYQLRTKVETLGYVRTLFTEVDNQYTSYIDAKTMLPYRADNTTRQGKTNEDDTISIDQQRRIARYADSSEIALPSDTFDLPSLVYALRLRDIKADSKPTRFSALFGKHPNGTSLDATSLCVRAPSVVEMRLPADLVAGCELVTTGMLDPEAGAEGSVQLQVLTTKPARDVGLQPSEVTVTVANGQWTANNWRSSYAAPILVHDGSAARKRIESGFEEFRSLFPAVLCYTRIVPVDEVVTLTLFYREDDHTLG